MTIEKPLIMYVNLAKMEQETFGTLHSAVWIDWVIDEWLINSHLRV